MSSRLASTQLWSHSSEIFTGRQFSQTKVAPPLQILRSLGTSWNPKFTFTRPAWVTHVTINSYTHASTVTASKTQIQSHLFFSLKIYILHGGRVLPFYQFLRLCWIFSEPWADTQARLETVLVRLHFQKEPKVVKSPKWWFRKIIELGDLNLPQDEVWLLISEVDFMAHTHGLKAVLRAFFPIMPIL